MNIKVYQSGLKFMLINAVKRLFGGEVYFAHSLDHGIYGYIEADRDIDEATLGKIKEYMNQMVASDLPFDKKIVSKKEAYQFYKNKGQKEKAFNVLNIPNVAVSMCSLEGQYNYFYTHDIPASTGVLKYFDLYYVDVNKFVLIYPWNGKLDFTFRYHLYDTFREYDTWSYRLNVPFVANLNNIIAQGHIEDLIRKNDIIMNANINDIARDIIDKDKKIILLAGPSSSGKTTSSRKLSLYLSSYGVNAVPISLDDFYLDNDKKPVMSDGKVDYESVDAIDVNYFSDCLNKLLQGESVQLPIYDFTTGTHTLDKPLTITDNDVLVVEGLHAINPKVLELLDPNVIYKIYLSPLTPLGIDRHNYVSTTDNRLLRRMIRDFRTRGCDAERTILTWGDVRTGEENYIFPYTDTVDKVLNTAYIYEMGVLKVFCEPLLKNIPMDSEAYDEARRLLDALNVFYPISSEIIPHDNVLREFIGGSVFEK